ncbi:hypothetical protein GAYE_SCF00G1868 [Galdieria yellowstonensis]|uniref:BZIP domain-containing protein n=1 Tax=Galdieria yellowstonensis TaxID=3028027 RepID=A0AAV9I993_9RHOD|nr:hypothetical protein GAYE_SCF00G1868 [Galdieria yellowstonensis]
MSSSQFQNSIDELSKENFGFNGNEAFYETKQIAFQGDSSWAFNTNGEPCSEMTTCMSALSHSTSFETAECGLREVKRAKRVERNRQSAAASRERKKRYIEQLERRVSILSADNVRLQMELWKQLAVKHENRMLTEENSRLREELHFHQSLLSVKEREGLISTSITFDFN